MVFSAMILNYNVFTEHGITCVNKMHFGMKHAPGAGSVARTVDLRSNELLLCYGCPACLVEIKLMA